MPEALLPVLLLGDRPAFVADPRAVVRDASAPWPAQPILPLAAWLEQNVEKQSVAVHVAGVWLAPSDDLRALVSRLTPEQPAGEKNARGAAAAASFLIALDFPKLGDGRAYSLATLLRTRFQYRGELRAIGEVPIDQLHFMRRVGFDSAQLRAEWSTSAQLPVIERALAAFSDAYQGAVDQPQPAYRRHLRPAASGRTEAS